MVGGGIARNTLRLLGSLAESDAQMNEIPANNLPKPAFCELLRLEEQAT
jgi:hypothetical protein